MKKTPPQWARWGPDQPEQHYLIEPRYLAGGGDLRHVTEYLRASGWIDKTKRDGPLVFVSRDKSTQVAYDPYAQPGGWRIQGAATAHQDAWHVTFDRHTPVEIVAGMTDALTRPATAHAPNVWGPLQQQRWRRAPGGHPTAISPDGAAFLQWHQAGPGQAVWRLGAGVETVLSWSATATSTTPMHLMEALTTAMAAPEPVMRPRGHVPPTSRIRAHSRSVLPSQLRGWQQNRLNAARAATWARGGWTSARPRGKVPPRFAAQGVRNR
ncbi:MULTISPECIES: DUF317 domain-containing protein [Streptomyces]|uniref:DUF317 domain-containing protein n=1 Tax=Streptomyces ramulosus TaxID=47762 RepID=A0ABW1FSP9_9ACTN